MRQIGALGSRGSQIKDDRTQNKKQEASPILAGILGDVVFGFGQQSIKEDTHGDQMEDIEINVHLHLQKIRNQLEGQGHTQCIERRLPGPLEIIPRKRATDSGYEKDQDKDDRPDPIHEPHGVLERKEIQTKYMPQIKHSMLHEHKHETQTAEKIQFGNPSATDVKLLRSHS